jgi:gliding motility-associated-like protein
MKRLYLMLLFGSFFTAIGQAQVAPPDFLCVKGDTLFWDLPTNSCGPFNSYDIYFSINAGGPFSPLAAVTDPAKDFYFHPNPGGETRYYYLVSNYDCPGQNAPASDTLDNRPPEISPIRKVSVEGGQVLVSWTPSPSPEVLAYVIYRETSIGVVPIDTVYSGTTYLDTQAAPGSQPESYFVNALDGCGNTSIFDAPHNTIFLEYAVNPCNQTIELDWNPYLNWTNGVAGQELWVGVNGAAPSLFTALDAGATAHSFGNVVDGDTYCFFIRAKEQATGEESNANEVCVVADVVRPMKDFYVKNATVTTAGTVEISWGWDTAAEINTVDILQAGQNGAYQVVSSMPAQLPLSPTGTYEDLGSMPGGGKLFYKIQTTDNCDTVVQSTYGSTIFLSGTSLAGNINQLNWTALDIENAGPVSYELYRSVSGTEAKIASLSAADTAYADAFDPADFGGTSACYYVVAKGTLTLPDGSQTSILSRSNTVCVEQPLRIYVPNAFAPNGINQEFRPLIVPEDVADYELLIFNRYGEQLFVSSAPGDGWGGKKNGKLLPQGVYVYRIKVVQSSGQEELRTGTVLLLR